MYLFNLILSKSTLKLANETCQKISENNNTLLFITVTSLFLNKNTKKFLQFPEFNTLVCIEEI